MKKSAERQTGRRARLTVLGVSTRKLLILIGSLILSAASLIGIATTSATAASPASTHTTSARADLDCSDFATQAAAQRYFIVRGGPRSDPDRLDADGDGVACESNPCPCSTATGPSSPPPGPQQPPQPQQPPLKVDRAVVIKVIDGDTVDVRLRAGSKVRVRLLGIDTPEVFGGRECGGAAASRNAKRMLPRGTPVILTSDRSQDLKDRFGRLLRYVQKAGNRVDVGRVQVHKGHAEVYVFNNNPFKKVNKYRAEERSARRAKRGLWGACR